jgi:aspartate kinase
MKVFKFGGASVKDAQGLKNLVHIVQSQGLSNQLLIVVSAMGRSTNAFEDILEKFWQKGDYQLLIDALYNYHQKILKTVFPAEDEAIHTILQSYFNQISQKLQSFGDDSNYDLVYDQIVSFGELISTQIVHYALQTAGLSCYWLDARECIKTDATFREGRIDWNHTQSLIEEKVKNILSTQIVVTQGFIGCTSEELTTTLGREGSDFSGSIFAACLAAESLTIWKDVPGVLNADPKKVPNAELFKKLSYQEASEMTYYGASVIHPKTIAPLKLANIPLYVRSFLSPEQAGTCISQESSPQVLPTIIFKNQQILVHFEPLKFNYLREDEVAQILKACAEVSLKVNLLLKTAFRVSICSDKRLERIDKLKNILGEHFDISYELDKQLITFRKADEITEKRIIFHRRLWIEIRQPEIYQVVVSE